MSALSTPKEFSDEAREDDHANGAIVDVAAVGAVPMSRSQPHRPPRAIHAAAHEVKLALAGRSLVLVGLMGCGKTSIGRRLAQTLDLPFADADEEIEHAADQSISEIFSSHGEAYFRDGERKVIARLLSSGPLVLATGGGAFINVQTRANIKARGLSIWLKADLPVLMRRVMRRGNRPLLKTPDPEARMRELMDQRYPIYAEADVVVESRDVAHDVMVADLVDVLLKRHLRPSTPKSQDPP